MFMERNVGVTECPRSLNPRKAVAMATFPIICLFYCLARALDV